MTLKKIPNWLQPVPVFRTLSILLIVGYAFAVGYLVGALK